MLNNTPTIDAEIDYLLMSPFEELRAVFLEAYKGQVSALEKEQEALRRQIAALECKKRELGKLISVLGGSNGSVSS